MKQCNKCNEIKPINDFSKAKSNSDGYSYQCKKCKAENTSRYVKTLLGKLQSIYQSQCKSSVQRKHPKPDYSKKEFIEWALTKTQFTSLYSNWVNSNYQKLLSPSFDRLDDSIGYSFDNLRLVVWEENRDKLYDQRISGNRITKQNKKIAKYTLEEVFLEEYPSIAKAARDNNVIRTNLNSAIVEGRPRFGFIWKYV